VVSVVSGHSVVPFELLLSLEDARLMIVEAKLLEDALGFYRVHFGEEPFHSLR
jgi:hypothetical protein